MRTSMFQLQHKRHSAQKAPLLSLHVHVVSEHHKISTYATLRLWWGNQESKGGRREGRGREGEGGGGRQWDKTVCKQLILTAKCACTFVIGRKMWYVLMTATLWFCIEVHVYGWTCHQYYMYMYVYTAYAYMHVIYMYMYMHMQLPALVQVQMHNFRIGDRRGRHVGPL